MNTGENLGRSTGHAYRQMPHVEAVVGATWGVDKEDCGEECMSMESSDIVYTEVYVF